MAVLYPHSEIEILQHRNKAAINISEGDQLVFSIDDVKLGNIYFQVPEYRRFFRYADGSMKNVDLIIVKDNEVSIPESGEINGFKIANALLRTAPLQHSVERTVTLARVLTAIIKWAVQNKEATGL